MKYKTVSVQNVETIFQAWIINTWNLSQNKKEARRRLFLKNISEGRQNNEGIREIFGLSPSQSLN